MADSILLELSAVIISAAVHEAGHIISAWLLKIPLRNVKGRFSGMRMSFDFSAASYFSELLVHLSGPVFGIILSVIASSLGLYRLAGTSVILSAVNLLPLSAFDGGGIVRCIACSLFPPESDAPRKICSFLSVLFLILLWLAVMWTSLRLRAELYPLIFVLVLMTEYPF